MKLLMAICWAGLAWCAAGWRGPGTRRPGPPFCRGCAAGLLSLLLAAGPARAQQPDSTLRSAAELMGADSLVQLPAALPAPLPALPAPAPTLADYRYADSLLAALATQQRWAALDSAGHRARLLGADYPLLHRRLGQAALHRDHPAQALREYGAALRANPLDTLARYGQVLAYRQLNQPGPAALLAAGLPDSLRRALHLGGFSALTEAEAEVSGQFSTTVHRGPSLVARVGLSSRLGPRFTLTQNFSHFSQQIDLPDEFRRGFSRRYGIRQNQYHVLLGAQLAPRWRALAGYHVLRSDLGRRESPTGQLGYLALRYARPCWTAQAGLYAGTLTDTARTQADLRLTVFPAGSLRLYVFGRASVVRSAGRSFPNGVAGAGGRVHPRAWLEAFGGLGQVPVLAELDGTYVYNLLDPVRGRAGASLLLLLPRQLSLRLAAGTEQRRDGIDGTYYSLYSLSTSLAWTW